MEWSETHELYVKPGAGDRCCLPRVATIKIIIIPQNVGQCRVFVCSGVGTEAAWFCVDETDRLRGGNARSGADRHAPSSLYLHIPIPSLNSDAITEFCYASWPKPYTTSPVYYVLGA